MNGHPAVVPNTRSFYVLLVGEENKVQYWPIIGWDENNDPVVFNEVEVDAKMVPDPWPIFHGTSGVVYWGGDSYPNVDAFLEELDKTPPVPTLVR